MKKYIQVYHNNIPLCGSDFAMVLKPGLSNRQISNRVDIMAKRMVSLSNIMPYLKTGVLTFKVESN